MKVNDEVQAEMARAVAKFPTWPTDPFHALAVLGEEFGELTKAVLQHTYEPHKNVTGKDIRTEAIQTAAMALRWAMSLPVYEYRQSPQHYQGGDDILAVMPAHQDIPKERTVDDLQRELLAICKGGSFADTWRKVTQTVQWPGLASELSKVARVRELRRQIQALNPNAALYYGWAGPGDDTDPKAGVR